MARRTFAILTTVVLVGLLGWFFFVNRSGQNQSSREPHAARENTDLKLSSSPNSVETASAQSRVPTQKDVSSNAGSLFSAVGRLVTNSLTPIVGAKIRLTCRPGQAESKEVYCNSAHDGSFKLEYYSPLDIASLRFQITTEEIEYARYYQDLDLLSGQLVNLGDIVLEFGGSVQGIVSFDDGTIPAESTVVAAFARADDDYTSNKAFRIPPKSILREVQSSVNGSFRMNGLPVGLLRLWIQIDKSWYVHPPAVTVKRGLATDDVRISISRAEVECKFVKGTLLAPDRTRVANGLVYWSDGPARGTVVTNADGKFQILAKRGVNYKIVGADRGGKFRNSIVAECSPSFDEVDLVLQSAEHLTLAVSTESGTPIANFSVVTNCAVSQGWPELDSLTTVSTTGQAEILVPTGRFFLDINASGFEALRVGPLVSGAIITPMTLVLKPLESVHGIVTFNSQPVSGIYLSLHSALNHGYVGPFAAVAAPISLSESKSDHVGAFNLHVPAAGSYFVNVRSTLYTAKIYGPIVIGPRDGSRGSPVQIELFRAGAIEGSVLLPKGPDTKSILVAVSCGDGIPKTVYLDTASKFRFTDLCPGNWEIRVLRSPLDSGYTEGVEQDDNDPPVARCNVVAGETFHCDLDLSSGLGGTLRGQFQLGGLAIPGLQARLSSLVDPNSPAFLSQVDSNGEFSCEKPVGRRVKLELALPPWTQPTFLYSTELEWKEPSVTWTFDPPTGTLEVSLGESKESAKFVTCVWNEADGGSIVQRKMPDGARIIVFEHVPTGVCKVILVRNNERRYEKEVIITKGTRAVCEFK